MQDEAPPPCFQSMYLIPAEGGGFCNLNLIQKMLKAASYDLMESYYHQEECHVAIYCHMDTFVSCKDHHCCFIIISSSLKLSQFALIPQSFHLSE